jgi:hypothetical protein
MNYSLLMRGDERLGATARGGGTETGVTRRDPKWSVCKPYALGLNAMAHQLDFADDFPEIVPDPPLAHVQFSARWKCINIGDEPSPEAGVVVELFDGNGTLIITSIGRNVAALSPGQTDEDTVGIGAVGPGSGSVRVTIGGADGVVAEIPIAVT